jgi:hypothetical protein
LPKSACPRGCRFVVWQQRPLGAHAKDPGRGVSSHLPAPVQYRAQQAP